MALAPMTDEEVMGLQPEMTDEEVMGLKPDTQAPNTDGRFVKGVKRGAHNLASTGYGLAAVGADLVGADGVRDKMIAGFQDQNKQAEAIQSDVPSYTDIRTDGVGNFLTDAGKYAVDAFAENIPMFIPSLVTGGLGAVAAAPGRAAAEKLIEGSIAKHVATLAGEGLVGAEARKVAEARAAEEVGKHIAKRTGMGAAAGAYPSSAGMEVGSIYSDIYNDTGESHPGLALGGGAVAGALDVIPQVHALRNALGPAADELTGSLIRRLGVAGGKTILEEMGTEGLQTVIEQVTAQQANPNKPFDWNDVVDSMLKGLVGGGVMGAGGEAVRSFRNRGMDGQPKPQTGDQMYADLKHQTLNDQLDQRLAEEMGEASQAAAGMARPPAENPTIQVTPGGTALNPGQTLDPVALDAMRRAEAPPAAPPGPVARPTGPAATPDVFYGAPTGEVMDPATFQQVPGEAITRAHGQALGVIPGPGQVQGSQNKAQPSQDGALPGGIQPGAVLTFAEVQRATGIKNRPAVRDLLANLEKNGRVSRETDNRYRFAGPSATGSVPGAGAQPPAVQDPAQAGPGAAGNLSSRTPEDALRNAPGWIAELRGQGWTDQEIDQYADAVIANGGKDPVTGYADPAALLDSHAMKAALRGHQAPDVNPQISGNISNSELPLTPTKSLDDTGRTAPEASRTLELQQKAVLEGRRPVMMFPSGTSELPVPAGLARLETPRGVFHYDPSKIDPATIEGASNQGRENEILGYGPKSKAEVMAEPDHVAVVERAPDGTEVLAALATKGDAPGVMADMQARAGQGHTVTIDTPENVVGARQSGAKADLGINPQNGEPFTSTRQVRAVHASIQQSQMARKMHMISPQAIHAFAAERGLSDQEAHKLLTENSAAAEKALASLDALMKASAFAEREGTERGRAAQVKFESQGDGTRAAPVAIRTAEDVARAGDQVNAEPTEGQKSAGNYQKGHATWAGMGLSIETPAGGERSGVGPDGRGWWVRLKHAYGYVKRTKGADNEHIDITLGNNPNAPTVFVIDQYDPKTGKFDEHKSFGAFDTEAEAVAAYDQSFSDDSGPRRRGAVTAMPRETFKEWAEYGNTKKALADRPERLAPAAPVTVKQWVESDRPLDVQAMAKALKMPPFVVQGELQDLVKAWALKQRQPGKAVQDAQAKLAEDLGKRADLKARNQPVPPLIEKRIAKNQKTVDRGAASSPFVRVANRGPMSLLQWLAGATIDGKKGMADPGGEIKAENMLAHFEGGFGRPFNKAGADPDKVREAAIQAHYLPPGATVNDLFAAIKRDALGKKSGERVYAIYGDNAPAAGETAAEKRAADRDQDYEARVEDDVRAAAADLDLYVSDEDVRAMARLVANGMSVQDAIDAVVNGNAIEDVQEIIQDHAQEYPDGFDPFALDQEENQPARDGGVPGNARAEAPEEREGVPEDREQPAQAGPGAQERVGGPFVPAQHLLLVADSPETLRKQDIARLFEEAPANAEDWHDLRIYLIEQRRDLTAEILDAVEEAGGYPRDAAEDAEMKRIVDERNARQAEKGAKIKAALAAGKKVILRTQTKATEYSNPEDVNVTKSGVQFRQGNRWNSVTEDILNDMVAQAGDEQADQERATVDGRKIDSRTTALLRALGHGDDAIEKMTPAERKDEIDKLNEAAKTVTFHERKPTREEIASDGAAYVATGEKGAMYTLRMARISNQRVDDNFVRSLSTNKADAIKVAQMYAAATGRKALFWGAPETLNEFERGEQRRGGGEQLVDQSGGAPVPADINGPENRTGQPAPIEVAGAPEAVPDQKPITDMSDTEVMDHFGLKMEGRTSRGGNPFWALSGNFTPISAILDKLGFAQPYSFGRTVTRSKFQEADPTAKLAAALRGDEGAQPQAVSDDRAKAVLEGRRLSVERSGSEWMVTGKGTFDAKRELYRAGGKWSGKAWVFSEDPTQKLAETFVNDDEESRPKRERAEAAYKEYVQKRRREEDARPDERPDLGDPARHVSAETKKLIRVGEKYGIPEVVTKEQIEDVGMIVSAYERKKPVFVLANDAGTGKTFVLGGAIKELRERGQKKFVYVTMNQDLIEQIKRDLAPYDLEGVTFSTYADLSTKGAPDTSGAVLIADEAHNLKNFEGASRGKTGQDIMAQAKMTILSSATPYENPAQAGYLDATGVFEPAGGFQDWAEAYGATKVITSFTDKFGRAMERISIQWRGAGKKENGKAAREWLAKQGILTQRAMRIPPDMTEVQFLRSAVTPEYLKMYQHVLGAYETALSGSDDSDISMHRENVLKRILEASKTEAAIERARGHLKAGKSVVVFVETKSDRTLGMFRKSARWKDDTLYTYPQLARMMDQWRRDSALAKKMGGDVDPPPFAPFIEKIAGAFHEAGVMYELPSTADRVKEALGDHGVGIYTGAVSPKAATKAKKEFLEGKHKVLIATMAKGGTGLSLHDTVGNRPTVQVNINLPWVATGVAQVSGRVARYGLQSKARIEWLFAANIPWEADKLAPKVGARMRDMGAIVGGIDVPAAEILDGDFDFEGEREAGFGNAKDATVKADRDPVYGYSDGHPQWVKSVEATVGGRTVYSDKDVALVEGFSIMSGKPVYIASTNDGTYTRADIASYTGDAFTADEKKRLLEAREGAIAADKARRDARPDGPFTKGEKFAASENTPKELQETARAWLKMLGIDARVYLTTYDDARDVNMGDRAGLHGPYYAVRSAVLADNERGATRQLSNGDHYIVLDTKGRQSRVLETLAHEIGHILEKTAYKNATPEQRTAIENAYRVWMQRAKSTSAKEWVHDLRAHTTAKLTKVNVTGMASNLPGYWTSFSEFFADQVSRWATSSDKPVGAAGQFFKRIADALKRLYASVAGKKFLPTPEMKAYLDARADGVAPLQGNAKVEPEASGEVSQSKTDMFGGRQEDGRQLDLAGTEQSAKQAAEARGERMKGKKPQKAADEGLFGSEHKQKGFEFAAAAKRNKKANNSILTEAFKRWFGRSKVVNADGTPRRVFRGDWRGDKVGDRMRVKAATSGRFYFTEDTEMANSYASGKEFRDDATADFENWFKFPSLLGPRERTAPNLIRAWFYLSPEQREKVKDTLLRARIGDYEDGDTNVGKVMLSEQPDGGIASTDHWEYEVKAARGNWLQAAREVWLNSGSVFNDEGKFAEILRKAGLKVDYDSPHDEQPAILPVYLSIKNPVDTAQISQSFVDDLNARVRKLRDRPARETGHGSMWDKVNRNSREWLQLFNADYAEHGGDMSTSSVWTSVPEAVTKTLQAMGYDGIQDTGGKGGGRGHRVWIAFEPSQVKSSFNQGAWSSEDDRLSYSPSPATDADPVHADRIAEVTREVERIVDEITGGTAHVSVESKILGGGAAARASGAASGRQQEMAGAYRAIERLVRVALNENAPKAAVHEAWHHLQSWGVFTPAETKALAGSIDRFKAQARAEGLDVSKMTDRELEAVAFARFWEAKRNEVKTAGLLPGVIRAFNKAINIIRRIKNWMTGKGYMSPEDVFGKALSGDIAARGLRDNVEEFLSAGEQYAVPTEGREGAAFRKWFGNSKIVDENGDPLVVWHGSPDADFEAFDPAKANQFDPDASVVGFWFSDSQRDANTAGSFPWGRPNAKNPQVRPFYLSIKNPATRKDVRAVRKELGRFASNQEVTDELKRRGFDGYIHSPRALFTDEHRQELADGKEIKGVGGDKLRLNEHGTIDIYNDNVGGLVTDADDLENYQSLNPGTFVAFDPTQIKSTENRGIWAPTDPRVDYAAPTKAEAKRREEFSVQTLTDKAAPIYKGDEGADVRSKDVRAISKRIRGVAKEDKPTWQRVREAIDVFRENGVKSVLQGIADSYYAIGDLERRANKGELRDASKSAYKAVHATKNLNSVMAVVLRHGPVTLRDGGFVPVEGFKDGFQGIFKGVLQHGELELFKDYLIAKRAQRLAGEGRENLLDDSDIKAILAEANKADGRKARFEEANKRWQAFNGVALDTAVKAGRISRAQADFWQKDGDYVPFYRVMADLEDGKSARATPGGMSQRGPLSKRLEGGAQQLGDPIENMVMNLTKIYDSSFKNEALRRTMDLAVDMGVAVKRPQANAAYTKEKADEILKANGIDVDKLSPAEKEKWLKMTTAMVEPPGTGVTVWRDGVAETYDVYDPFLMRSLTSLSPAQLGGMMKLLRGARRLLTEGVTISPAFMAANFMRDSLSTWAIGGQSKYNPLVDAPKGLLKAWKKDPSVLAIAAAGGGTLGHYDTTPDDVRKLIDRELRGVDKTRVVDGVRKAWELWHRVGQASEQANRIAIYNKVIEAGGTEAEAAYQARDLLDFSMRGDYAAVRFLTETIPFLNARIQGLYRLYRGAAKGAPDSPSGVQKQFLMVGGLIMGATLALAMANNDDPRYDALQDWDKDTYWHFWIDGEHWRIPKPFEVGALFGTLPERMVRLWNGQDDSKRFTDRMVQMFGSTFAIDVRPQLLKPMIEAWANKDSFSGSPIVSHGLEKLKPEAQYQAGTSETARILGAAIPDGINSLTKDGLGFDIKSPQVIDHLIRGYLGELGTYMVTASDVLARAAGDQGERPTKHIADYPVISRFFRGDAPRTERYIEDFYKMRSETEAVVSTAKAYMLRGEADKAKELLADTDNREKLALRGALSTGYEAISKITAAMKQVQDSKTMDGDEKRDMLDKLTAQRNKVAKAVVDKAPAVAALMRQAETNGAARRKLAEHAD